MSVLVEALCLVIPRLKLDVSWPGGTDAFLVAMCDPASPARRLMSDDVLASVSFFTPEACEVVAAELRARGLVEVDDGAFVDFATVDQRYGPTMPCPWLVWRRHPDGFTYAWPADREPGLIAVPEDWDVEQSRSLTRSDLRDEPGRLLKLAERADGIETWLDFETGQVSEGLARPPEEAASDAASSAVSDATATDITTPDSASGPLLAVVRAALDGQGWTHEVPPDVHACVLDVSSESITYRCAVIVEEANERVVLLLFAPDHVPEFARALACEYVVRANYALPYGNLDIDCSDGEWRFRVAVDVEGGALTPPMVETMAVAAIGTMDTYHDGMRRVVHEGVPPAQAVEDAHAARQRRDEALRDEVLPDEPLANEPENHTSIPDALTPESPLPVPAIPPAPDLVPPIPNAYVVPGTRLIAGEYAGSPPSNPTADLEAKLARFLDVGATVFVDLTDPADPLAPYEPTLRALAVRRGIDLVYERLSIPDMDVCDEAFMCRVLDTVDEHLAHGRTVYLHCWGGIGRTGTVIGCWLVRHGRSGADALGEVARLFATMSPEKVRRHRSSGSPQTAAQRAMVEGWGEGVMMRRTSAEARALRQRARARRAAPPIAHPESGARESRTSPTEPAAQDVVPREAPAEPSGREDAALARRIHTRLRGCLLGGALGDVLGWPAEFLALAQIRARYGADGIREPDPGASGGLGAFTDDTQMTLFTAEGILRSTTRHMEYTAYSEPDGANWSGEHMFHARCMRRAYQRWLYTQDGARAPQPRFFEESPGWLVGVRALHTQRAPGTTCLSALRAHAPDGDAARNDSKGCGGVMRVAPVGLVPIADPFDYAAQTARLTHGHASGYLSAGAYAHVLHDLLYARQSLAEAVRRVLPRLAAEPGHEEVTRALERAYALAHERVAPSAERVQTLGQGWTGEEALAIGIYCALVADDFTHGVRLAVNHSGDSDSTGSIAGALLGVQCGEYGLPASWVASLQQRDAIAAVADDLLVGYGGGDGWRTRYPGN